MANRKGACSRIVNFRRERRHNDSNGAAIASGCTEAFNVPRRNASGSGYSS